MATKYFSNALFLLNSIAFHFNCICTFALLIERLIFVHLHCFLEHLFFFFFWLLNIGLKISFETFILELYQILMFVDLVIEISS